MFHLSVLASSFHDEFYFIWCFFRWFSLGSRSKEFYSCLDVLYDARKVSSPSSMFLCNDPVHSNLLGLQILENLTNVAGTVSAPCPLYLLLPSSAPQPLTSRQTSISEGHLLPSEVSPCRRYTATTNPVWASKNTRISTVGTVIRRIGCTAQP